MIEIKFFLTRLYESLKWPFSTGPHRAVGTGKHQALMRGWISFQHISYFALTQEASFSLARETKFVQFPPVIKLESA